MQWGVQVDTIKRDSQTVPVYELLRFVVSYKLFNASLEKLTKSLPQSKFGILEVVLNETPSDHFDLLKQKGYYPYSYMSNQTKFSEDSFPPIEAWKKSLNGTTIKQNEWNHANRMWNLLGFKTMQDYYDAYLNLNCALLACCSEYCRKISFKTYKLDVVQFSTAPNMAKDSALLITKALEIRSIFGAHHCTLIPTVYCIKSRRLTSMPTWQRRKKFVENSIFQTIRTIIRSTPMLTTAEFSSSKMNLLVTTSRILHAWSPKCIQ